MVLHFLVGIGTGHGACCASRTGLHIHFVFVARPASSCHFYIWRGPGRFGLYPRYGIFAAFTFSSPSFARFYFFCHLFLSIYLFKFAIVPALPSLPLQFPPSHQHPALLFVLCCCSMHTAPLTLSIHVDRRIVSLRLWVYFSANMGIFLRWCRSSFLRAQPGPSSLRSFHLSSISFILCLFVLLNRQKGRHVAGPPTYGVSLGKTTQQCFHASVFFALFRRLRSAFGSHALSAHFFFSCSCSHDPFSPAIIPGKVRGSLARRRSSSRIFLLQSAREFYSGRPS